jgi:4-hydroxy-2-oxoheptanedioate aldolase
MSQFDVAIQRRGSAPLLGVGIHRYNPDFLEIASLLGFHAVWIEMEHGLMSFSEAADLCRMASGMGLLTMLRIPGPDRENALKAAECGPDIIDLPMANSPEEVTEFVRHCRYPPQGCRGYFTSSRSTRFGLNGAGKESHKSINGRLSLVAQIETCEGLKNIEAICRVPGLDGIFLGLGDLSVSLGVPDELEQPCVERAVEQILEVAKAHGKRILVPGSPGEAGIWATRGACLVFCCSDTGSMVEGARQAIQAASQSVSKTFYPARES